MYNPIEFVLMQPYIQGYRRNLFLVTDGVLSAKEDLAIAVLTSNCSVKELNVYAVGIGNGADVSFLARAAGACKNEYIFSNNLTLLESQFRTLLNYSYTYYHNYVKPQTFAVDGGSYFAIVPKPE